MIANESIKRNEVLQVVFTVVFDRKNKKLKDKGRKFTDRVYRQWLTSKRVHNDIAEILYPCLKKAELILPKNSDLFYELLKYLVWQKMPKIGRPAIKRGIINSAINDSKPKKLSGRPAKMSMEEEKEWCLKVRNNPKLPHLIGRRIPDKTAVEIFEKAKSENSEIEVDPRIIRNKTKQYQRAKKIFSVN